MHLQPMISRTAVCLAGRWPEDLFHRGLCLPSGSTLMDRGQQRVIDAFLGTPGLRR